MTTKPKSTAVVLQRPGRLGWILSDESLLTDPANRRRDPDVYLAERHAAGDPRIKQLPPGAPLCQFIEGSWQIATTREVAGRLVTPAAPKWAMDAVGKWFWT